MRELNDAFRTTMTGGRIVMTASVDALASDVKAMVIRRVATFADFTPDNDLRGEHDFGNFDGNAASRLAKISSASTARKRNRQGSVDHLQPVGMSGSL